MSDRTPSGRAVVITISSSRAAGAEAPDRSGPATADALTDLGLAVVAQELIGDDRDQIARRLVHWAAAGVDLVATTGGTGFAPDDVTPEATRDVIDREAPGVAEAMRLASREATAMWWLSRATAGVRGRTLIVNLPGNPKAIDECLGALAEGLPHALALLRGTSDRHG
ncbi:MAG: MogA/MoaB family molybdenum cofactor biosynthesis protein [Solirubrobacterales bacterium]